MNLEQAIKKVGKAMGDEKYGNEMMGAMLPSGDIGTTRAVAVLFGISIEEAEVRLRSEMNREYKRLCAEAKKAYEKRL